MAGRKRFINADAVIQRLPEGRRDAVEARARLLVAEELTLRELRKARDMTQKQLADTLGIGQDYVSRIEQRTDMLLSTLASYVKAMGGDLRLTVEFPDHAPVTLTRLSETFGDEQPDRPAQRRRKRAAK